MSSSAEDRQQLRLLDELRERRRDFLKTFGPAALVTLLGFVIALFFVEPAPPRELVIVTGNREGNYHAVGEEYAQRLAKHDVTLKVRETAGSVENFDLLLHDDGVQLAIVQGGTVPDDVGPDRLESLAALYLEPVWVFGRKEQSIARLSDLQGKRVAVGPDGSGTQMLAAALLEATGVHNGRNETVFVKQGGRNAVDALKSGDAKAAFFVLSATSPLIRELLLDEELELLSMDRSPAYARRFPFLKSVVLEQGVIDLALDLPRRRVKLIAPVANLVATSELHDAFIPVLLEAAAEVHRPGGLLSDTGEYPSMEGMEFPPSAVAEQYLKHGPSFFQRHLSFWVASLIDRTKIMLVPLLVLLIPLARLAPPVYRWRIRSRIYRWYALIRGIDQELRSDDRDRLTRCEQRLAEVERELTEVSVPLSYMEEFYNLHLHIDLVKRRLARRRESSPASNRSGVDSWALTQRSSEGAEEGADPEKRSFD